ncbi:MAG TPA: T9SS type A sorting domain-containing protein [Paludibacter sp.]|nr:T9SS type A sorting domain-containing protein [Paludibacter sp.]
MPKRIITIGVFLSVLACTLVGQVAMGKWRTHFAYNSVTQVAQSENKIFAVSDGALFSVDKQDGALEFYSKISGLNGTNISKIGFDKKSDQLFVIYANGNIDVLATNGVINIPDLYNKQIAASKDVNDIQFYQDKVYLSCNFGIIVLNSTKKEVADTYYIGPNATEVKVLNTTIHNGVIYALTSNTIFKADINQPNLVNYEYWTTVNSLPGIADLQTICSFAGSLFLLRGGKLYKQESDNTWTSYHNELSVTSLNVSNGDMFLYTNDGTYIVDAQLNSVPVNYNGTIADGEFDTTNNTFWFAATQNGVISYKPSTSEVQQFKPKGPAVNIPWEMTFAKKKLFVVPGGRWAEAYGRQGDVMMYEDGSWTNIYSYSIQSSTNSPVADFMNIAVDPTDDKHFFATSYGTGLFEFKNNLFYKWHNHTNSTLQGHPTVPENPWQFTRIDGAVFDQSGNLFLNNSAVTASVKVLLANGTWTQLTYPNALKETYGKLLINNQKPNQKWAISVRGGEILVFDDNGTIQDQNDDKSVVYTIFPDPDTDGAFISHNTNYAIAQDKNGVIWLGTEAGPLRFQNTTRVFDGGLSCSRVKIPRNDGTNNADYLLATEKIKAIAIDGANRKWFGTETSGVYLMSENGQETIQHFTTANSPLLSNDILSIAINQVTGEVFFGTAQGLVSYQSDAAETGTIFEDVYAYPNPVREDYKGVITITGLVDKTQIKITDINGNLVCQTVSNGSLATWDGKDVRGRKVSTGIYLAICVNADGTKSTITKIMVIN